MLASFFLFWTSQDKVETKLKEYRGHVFIPAA